MGEPLLNPKLDEILQIANENNIKINLSTNGTLLKEKIDVLTNNKIHKLTISLHSYEANTHRQTLDEYLDNILFAVNILHKKNPDTIIEFRLWNEGDLTNKNNLNAKILKKLCSTYNFSEQISAERKNWTLAPNIFLGFDNAFVWPVETIDKPHTCKPKFCQALRTHFGILCDGTVVPCCLDNNGKIKLGNIFEENIDKILSSDRAKNIYNGFSNRKTTEELCKNCQYTTKFDK